MAVETFDESFLQELERLLNDACDGCEGRPLSVGTGATTGRFGDINISKENWQPLFYTQLISPLALLSLCAWWHLLRRSCHLRVFQITFRAPTTQSESCLMATGAKLLRGAFPMSIEGWCHLSRPKFTLQSTCGPTGTSSGTIFPSSLMHLEYIFFYVQPQLRPAKL